MNFGSDVIFLATCFSSLTILSLFKENIRSYYLRKPFFDWFLELSNLILQGFLIPVLQVAVIVTLLKNFWPSGYQSLELGFVGGFLINIFFVDYCYYWNHRILHQKKFFPIHLIHHTVVEFDIFATSKNTIWTSFFIVYLYLGGVFIFLLDNPYGYIWGATVTAALDLWKHSNFNPKSLFFSKYLGLITPSEHAHHHGAGLHYNYGANFNFWDKMHGTYRFKKEMERHMGVKTKLLPWQKFLFPFQRKSS